MTAQQFIRFVGPKVWSNLPSTIKERSPLKKFTNKLLTAHLYLVRDSAASFSKNFFGQNCLDLGKFGWIWAKFGQN